MRGRGFAWVAAGLVACASQRPAVSPETPDVWLGAGAWRMPASVGAEVRQENAAAVAWPLKLAPLPGAPTVDVVGMVQPQLVPDPHDGVSIFKVLLSEHALAECMVRADRLHLGAALQRAFVEVATRPAKQATRLGPLETRRVGRFPVLLLLAEYLTPAHRYGAVRLAAANVHDVGVFCSMNAPGHRATFDRMVDGLVASLAANMAEPASQRRFHWVSQTGGWQGVAESVQHVRDDGAHVDMEFAGMLRVLPAGLAAVDELVLEVTAAPGELVMARCVRQEDGKVTRDVTLSALAGRHVGLRRPEDLVPKDLGRQFPTSARMVRVHLAEAQAAPAPSNRVFLRYYPGLDSQALAEETVERLQRGRFRSVVRTQGAEATAVYSVDPAGDLLRSTVTWPGGELTLTPMEE